MTGKPVGLVTSHDRENIRFELLDLDDPTRSL